MRELVAVGAAPTPTALLNPYDTIVYSNVRDPVASGLDRGIPADLVQRVVADYRRAELRWLEVEENRRCFGLPEVKRRFADLTGAKLRFHSLVGDIFAGGSAGDSRRTGPTNQAPDRHQPVDDDSGPQYADPAIAGTVEENSPGVPSPNLHPAGWLNPTGRQRTASPNSPERGSTRTPKVNDGHPANLEDDHRAADAELVCRLAETGFAGPAYDRFINQLARHGLAVLGSWIRTGQIIERCAQRGVRGLPSPIPPSWNEEDIEELIQDTVSRAVVDFERHALRAGRWRPDGGASLATYFIGAGLFAFADVYRRRFTIWRRDVAIRSAAAVQPLTDLPDIADTVAGEDAVRTFLQTTAPDARLRQILLLSLEGYTHAEIAATLGDGTTAWAVEAMVYRYRRQVIQGRGGNEDGC